MRKFSSSLLQQWILERIYGSSPVRRLKRGSQNLLPEVFRLVPSRAIPGSYLGKFSGGIGPHSTRKKFHIHLLQTWYANKTKESSGLILVRLFSTASKAVSYTTIRRQIDTVSTNVDSTVSGTFLPFNATNRTLRHGRHPELNHNSWIDELLLSCTTSHQ
jgi:hypothetical protein